MNQIEGGRDIAGEEGVDALLQEFFAQEVPAEFRAKRETPQLVAVSAGEPRVAGRDAGCHAGWMGLAVAAGSLLTITILLSQPGRDIPVESAPDVIGAADSSSGAGHVAATAKSAGKGAPSVEITVTEEFNEVDQYDTANGPVEQRSKMRMRNVSIVDPETGEKVEVLLPELDIEIFPIDDEKSSKNGGERE